MRWHRLPLRARLVAGFAVAMLVVLLAAGAYVFWRVQFALDHRLDQDLGSQSSDLVQASGQLPPAAALVSLRDEARETQLLSADGDVLASGTGIPGGDALLTPAQARAASRAELRTGRGNPLSPRGQHLRILAVPVDGRGGAAVAVSAVRLSQRDEALSELLAALAVANLLALAVASLVGYRLARAALDPVERYRAQAERIAQGETGVRLDIPAKTGDEISRLGATLNAMLDAQERAADRQRQFIDDASHELRTPLTTLSAEIALALRRPRSAEDYEAALRRIQADANELIELADALLTLGALGSSTPHAQDVPARTLLDTAAQRARSQFGDDAERPVTVRDEARLVVHGDVNMLDRALGNAVDNAIRYGAGEITVAAEPRSPSALALTVHDQGGGIPAEFLPYAAERFRQDQPSRSGPGAGLGLALVDAITTAHGGQLRICSSSGHHRRSTSHPELAGLPCAHPEHGTTITLLLPRVGSPSEYPAGDDQTGRATPSSPRGA
jgi:signal transduction histidine kinase